MQTPAQYHQSLQLTNENLKSICKTLREKFGDYYPIIIEELTVEAKTKTKPDGDLGATLLMMIIKERNDDQQLLLTAAFGEYVASESKTAKKLH